MILFRKNLSKPQKKLRNKFQLKKIKQPKKEIVKQPKKEQQVVSKPRSIRTLGIIYTVQIAALDVADQKYSSINNVITYSENSLIKYNLGSFRTFNEAQKYRSQIIRKYKGAFVKALKTMFQYS